MLTTVEKMLFLSSVEMFSDIPLQSLTAIAGIAEEVRRGPGEVVFAEGDVGDSLYLIVNGSVGVKKADGGATKLVATLGEGECVGEMAILSDEPRSASVETLEETGLLIIDKKSFKTLIRKNPEIAFHIFEILVKRLRGAIDGKG